MRRYFPLLQADQDYLQAAGLEWEAVVFNGVHWVLIPAYPVPPGYSATQATAALRLDLTYPDSQIDMVFFHPHLARTDGKHIPNLEGLDRLGGGSRCEEGRLGVGSSCSCGRFLRHF